MKELKLKNKKALKTVGIFVILVIIIIYLVIPIGFGFCATFRFKESVGKPPEGFFEVTLKTSDGVSLAAWYLPPQNGAVIILLHGATGSRKGIKAYAQMLSKHGYGVLAFDLRGHGESGGDGVNAYGWNGTKDVGAAVEYLLNQKDVKAVGGLGLSLGGEILLGASGTYPQIKAIVSDGASYRSLGDYLVLPSRRSLIRSFTTRVMFQATQFLSGKKPPERIVDSIARAQDTSFLFIAGGKVKKEILYGNVFVKNTNNRSELWIAEGVGHTGAYKKYPVEYEKRLIDFYDTNLLFE